MIERYKDFVRSIQRRISRRGIQFTLSLSFTIVAAICMGIIGITLQKKFGIEMRETKIESNEQIVNQIGLSLETYLRNMMRISDAMYYSAIKSKDISVDTLEGEMNLLYESNKDSLVSIACFDIDGNLLGAAPINTLKTDNNISDQDWFVSADREMENFHFSMPHVQNLFDDSSHRYYWVVSLSRIVELTSQGNNQRGVLLVDMNYRSIEQQFKKVNDNTSLGYCYLIGKNGEIIYHPKQELIYSELEKENNLAAMNYEDGSHQETFLGEERVVIVRTVGYTGWKIVSVIPNESFRMAVFGMQVFVVLIIIISLCILIFANRFISGWIAKPIKRLEDSVRGIEAGNLDIEIYEGGSYEIRRLGATIKSMVSQMRELMEGIVREQEQKRKMELDALQSQINPHFLYNTLDAIVWMIEAERYEDAITIVTQLASLFRISLSKGRNVISVRDEISHARNYMSIQKIRYKNKFTMKYDIQEEVYQYSTVKLIIQPLLENAIYYGMEFMDGDGIIELKAYVDDKVYIEVIDNGLGMPKENVEQLLIENNRVRKRGSGVGVINVHQRIRLRFGEQYGLEIESEPDEGTTVRICLPKILYSEIDSKGAGYDGS